jgi:DNA-directed RNA polymerase beta subunit
MTNNYDADGKQIYLDASEYIRRAETGTVDKTFFSYDNNGFMFVKVRLRKEKIPELGDKFASRSGQKGIMGMLLNEADMPVSARGVRPDMLINPQAFPKRMTISQFIEISLFIVMMANTSSFSSNFSCLTYTILGGNCISLARVIFVRRNKISSKICCFNFNIAFLPSPI